MSQRLPNEKLLELRDILASEAPDSNRLADFDSELSLAFVSIIEGGTREDLTVAQRKYLSSYELESEVNNGGVNQFLFNSGPQAATDALAFMRERQFETVANMLERVIQVFPGGTLPATLAELQTTLADDDDDRLTDAMEEIDSEFNEMDPYPDLTADRLRFVLEYPLEFFESDG